MTRGGVRGLWEVAITVADPQAEAMRLVDRGARIIAQAVDGVSVVAVGGGVAVELVRPE